MAKKSLGYIELNWTCPNCGTVNPGSAQSCVSCGNPQPENVQFQQAANQKFIEDQQKITRAQKGPDVHCPYCGTRNTADAEECRQCSGDLSDGHKRVTGQVLGAYTTGQASQKDIQCPSCSQPNAYTAQYCVHCGTPLKSEPISSNAGFSAPAVATSVSAITPKQKKFPVWAIIAVLLFVGACLIGAVILLFGIGGGNNEPIQATVTETYWEYTLQIEELQLVTRENWESEIPSDANILKCDDKLYATESEPSPGAVEVCGTPYSVDLGNGYAEVTQDCEYDIYRSYCSYEDYDWAIVNSVITEDFDLYPYWAEPELSSTQRIAAQEESYLVTFTSDNQSYQYSPPDLYDFQQCTPGSVWELDLTIFGSVKNITRVK